MHSSNIMILTLIQIYVRDKYGKYGKLPNSYGKLPKKKIATGNDSLKIWSMNEIPCLVHIMDAITYKIKTNYDFVL